MCPNSWSDPVLNHWMKVLLTVSIISLNQRLRGKAKTGSDFLSPCLIIFLQHFAASLVKIKRQQTIWPRQNKDNQWWFSSIFAKVAAFSFPLGMEEEKRCLSCVPHTENYLFWQYVLENAMKIPSRVDFLLPRICSVL